MNDRTVTLPPHLWELLETMAREMGVEPAALVNQAVFAWARTNGYFTPSAVEIPASTSDAPLNVQAELQEQEDRRAEADAAFESESESWFEGKHDPTVDTGDSEAPAEEDPPRVVEADEAIDALGEATVEAETSDSEPDIDALRAAAVVRIQEIAADVAALTTPVGLEDDGDTADADEDAQAEPEPEPEPEPEAEEDWTIDEAEDVPEPAVEDEDPWEDSAEEEPALAADDSPVPAPEPPSLELQDNSGWHDDEDESEAPGALAADDDDSISGVELDADLVSAPGLEDADDLAATDDAAPAWQETASPEDVDLASPKPVAPEVPVPVPPEPTAVEESEGEPDKDFDQLLADLEDLESDVGTMADPTRSSTALGGSTEVVESSATLSLTIEGDRTVEVEKTPFVIGRTSACDLQLRSERVSRQHAIIEKVGTLGFRIVDQGSSNGVWFGSERVTERMIRDGDILRIGDRRVRATIRVSAS